MVIDLELIYVGLIHLVPLWVEINVGSCSQWFLSLVQGGLSNGVHSRSGLTRRVTIICTSGEAPIILDNRTTYHITYLDFLHLARFITQ